MEAMEMTKRLVAYFSATGTTRKMAESIAAAAGGDLYEIEPKVPYTARDLDWTDRNSRSSREKDDPASRPEIKPGKRITASYDVIFLGFPIWWYTAPRIIRTFLESYDFSGRKIILFATSGGSGLGSTARDLRSSAPGAEILDGRVFHHASKEEIAKWVKKVTA